MNNNSIQFSIIIPTFNRVKLLENTLISLAQLEFPPQKFEIIVVDNGSIDDTKEMTLKFINKQKNIDVRYVYEPIPGLLSGRHRGAFESNGKILSFIDDDVAVTKNWLTGIDEAFVDQSVQIVGGKNLPNYEDDPPRWLSWFWINHPLGKWCAELSLLDFGDKAHEIEPIFVFGLNFSIRKSAFFALKGFNPDSMPNEIQYLQGDGETGLAKKALQENYKALYHPKVIVYHTVPKTRMTEEYFWRRYFFQGVSRSYAEKRYIKQISKTQNEAESTNTLIKLRRMFGRFKYKILDQINDNRPKELKRLKKKFKRAEIAGFKYHDKHVRANPKLLSWVLKSDYMDYSLPTLS